MTYTPVQTTPHPLSVKLKIRLWYFVQCTLYRWSPAPCRGFRRFLLRLFGAQISQYASPNNRARVDFPWNLAMDDFSSIGEDCWIYSWEKVSLGRYACLSQRTQIITASHDVSSPTFSFVTRPVVIGDNTWIAASAIILPGITIGEGAVIAAGAVVTQDVEPWTIVGGNPAIFIKKRDIKNG